jgi:hypothetical protein
MTSSIDSLRKALTAFAKGEDEQSEAAFREYSQAKSHELVHNTELQNKIIKEKAVYAKIGAMLLREFNADDPIQMDGQYIVVNGKRVGTVTTNTDDVDPNDPDYENKWEQSQSGINFTAADGKFSKEFPDIASLYQFISKQYLGTAQ